MRQIILEDHLPWSCSQNLTEEAKSTGTLLPTVLLLIELVRQKSVLTRFGVGCGMAAVYMTSAFPSIIRDFRQSWKKKQTSKLSSHPSSWLTIPTALRATTPLRWAKGLYQRWVSMEKRFPPGLPEHAAPKIKYSLRPSTIAYQPTHNVVFSPQFRGT